MTKYFGAPYPIQRTPRGFLCTVTDVEAIKSDMRILLLTNPGERVMLPEFGTPLRRLMFEPNDLIIVEQARQMIVDSINRWEPRIRATAIEVSNDSSSLTSAEVGDNDGKILLVTIDFTTFDDIQEIQQLTLQIPLSSI